ncbi:MAG TPA: malonyl-[acyl-carrier protein] O-methyltransferase BioC [Leucothrix mucor]|uniref:Malonyl-[acyl-carrier protein] O-methyltransferase n=1 Tax=Leucothrix mucor TaxID=45248 RepID=A0A7V2WU16_LEUMU|nr:malonyl-[acyl-carrier protein] O-methyltransferase BioC [Leucothrix mucor]
MDDQYLLDKAKVRNGFERAANSYDTAAVLQREVASRLLERLDYIRLQPNRVLDLGCGTGTVTADLLKRYPKAQIIALDLALNMLKKTQLHGKGWLRKKPFCLCADAERLPLKDDSVDLLISNLMLQWSNDLPTLFTGFQKVIAPNGLLMFTTFGPDTLKEMRESWAKVDNISHTSQFIDMHDIGDALLQAGFSDPVMDMEIMTMTYDSVRDVMRDIKNIGATNATRGRAKGLMGKQRLAAFEVAYEDFKQPDGFYPATWEVLYGHAWAPQGLQVDGFDKIIAIKQQ